MQSIVYIDDYRAREAGKTLELSFQWQTCKCAELWRNEKITADSSIVELTNGIDAEILVRLAESPVVNERTLETLAFNDSVEVRQAVADNAKTPYRTLMMLVNDESVDVRYHLAENYQVPDLILKVLTADENPYVSCRALETLRRKAHHAKAA